jgi:hypothetical protein
MYTYPSKFFKATFETPFVRLFHSETDFHANWCWMGSTVDVVLFNDGVSGSDYTASNGWMINEL